MTLFCTCGLGRAFRLLCTRHLCLAPCKFLIQRCPLSHLMQWWNSHRLQSGGPSILVANISLCAGSYADSWGLACLIPPPITPIGVFFFFFFPAGRGCLQTATKSVEHRISGSVRVQDVVLRWAPAASGASMRCWGTDSRMHGCISEAAKLSLDKVAGLFGDSVAPVAACLCVVK